VGKVTATGNYILTLESKIVGTQGKGISVVMNEMGQILTPGRVSTIELFLGVELSNLEVIRNLPSVKCTANSLTIC